ncbi:MAG: class I SAM-dependent methyltransferase [Zoogloeaceae bacterium]|jgi:ubiquinone/menaquinone biosynthesis C-methylase UbiE|nr:class I SAM-dependent methyltransferase [Zoogloeaceae bacterium]
MSFCSSSVSPIELDFSRKYDASHAQAYLKKHKDGLARRLSHWREAQIGRRALELAGNPRRVLDLPCGAGRFWPMLCEERDRRVLAADNSADMLSVARGSQPPEIVARIRTFQTSAFAIDLEDGAVDCVFCIRLLHHIEDARHRLAMLREFHRVSSGTVICSLWVDGNYMSWRRNCLESRRKADAQVSRNRFVVARPVIESEFRAAGWNVVAALDFLPGYAMWRTYVLAKEARGHERNTERGARGGI